MKEGLLHLYFTFPSTPKETHPPQKKNKQHKTKTKKCQEDCPFSFPKVSQEKKKKFVINFVFPLFPPDFGKFQDKRCGNIFFSSIFSYPTLMAIFSRGYAKRRNDYCCGAELCKCVTHSDVKKSICRRQPDWYRFIAGAECFFERVSTNSRRGSKCTC